MGLVKRLRAAFRARDETGARLLTLDDPTGWRTGNSLFDGRATTAMKISAVNAAVELRSDSFGKLPVFVMNENTKEHIPHHYATRLLAGRPNEIMTPFVFKKLMEVHRLQFGNAYTLIVRDAKTARPRELLPLHPDWVLPHLDDGGRLWYVVTNPRTGELRKLPSWDLIHLKGYSEDGITGISVLSRAAQVIATATAQQAHERRFYDRNARPSGVLSVAADLSDEARNKVREDWEKIHSGADNSFRIAILSNGLQYQPTGISQKDAQFVESRNIVVEDIARFYGVPLYKLQAGKQSYNSNEQNAIEYVVSGLHPTVQQAEEELTYKLLFDSELARGMEVRINLNAEVRGAMAARGAWYKTMRETGAFSVNDILALEDRPPVEGGDERYASLNYVPLADFAELSRARAQNGGGKENEHT